MGAAILFLDIGLAGSLLLWTVRVPADPGRSIAYRYFIVTALLCFHLLEEYLTGFQTRFPLLFGYGYAWSDAQFLSLNLAWLGILVLNGAWLLAKARLSYLLTWFIAIMGIANGLAHPLLSLQAGGYFPGLITSPLMLLAGLALFSTCWRRSTAAAISDTG